VSFGIDRRARSKKGKGLLRRGPDPKEIGDRLGRLIKRMEKGAVARAAWKQDRFVVEVAYHDAAPPAKLVLGPDAMLAVTAETSGLGPAYHAHVLARLAPVLDELDFVWAEPAPDPEQAMCTWLAGELAGNGRVNLIEREFLVDAPVLTRMGPRDAAWRAAVIADPKRGLDAFPWTKAGPGYAALANALVAMWLEVPWREPIDKDERATMAQVDEDLAAAHAAGIADLPYAEWAELRGYLKREPGRIPASDRASRIGYRRFDVDVELSGGWYVRLPGSFVGAWEDDGARYWATDGDRTIEFTSLTATTEDDSAKLLAVAPERHPVVERIAEPLRHGRAEVFDEDDVHIVTGIIAMAPDVAIVTCKGAVADEAWALATWRSLSRRA
jgi:hypothetical protein